MWGAGEWGILSWEDWFGQALPFLAWGLATRYSQVSPLLTSVNLHIFMS